MKLFLNYFSNFTTAVFIQLFFTEEGEQRFSHLTKQDLPVVFFCLPKLNTISFEADEVGRE